MTVYHDELTNKWFLSLSHWGMVIELENFHCLRQAFCKWG